MISLETKYDRTAANIVATSIAHHIWPFDPGMVEITVLADIGLDPTIIVTSSLFIDDEFRMDGRELYVIPDTYEMAAYLGDKAGQYYASLMNEPVPTNIELSNN